MIERKDVDKLKGFGGVHGLLTKLQSDIVTGIDSASVKRRELYFGVFSSGAQGRGHRGEGTGAQVHRGINVWPLPSGGSAPFFVSPRRRLWVAGKRRPDGPSERARCSQVFV